MKGPLKPFEILDILIESCVEKGRSSNGRLMMLGLFGGAFIGLAAQASNMTAHQLLFVPETYGIGRVLCGAIFTVGLMLVVLCGGELFTGNVAMLSAVCDRKMGLPNVFRVWVILYAANLIGSIFIAYLIFKSGLLHSGNDVLGAMTIKIAAGKTSLEFVEAFVLGLLCNWLVCLAVWLSTGADSMAGKIMSIFFPIWLFATSGFEHSIANMYYIPAGIFAKTQGGFVNLTGLESDVLDNLNWGSFFIDNLLPVSLGNLVGGGIFVGVFYWIIFRKL